MSNCDLKDQYENSVLDNIPLEYVNKIKRAVDGFIGIPDKTKPYYKNHLAMYNEMVSFLAEGGIESALWANPQVIIEGFSDRLHNFFKMPVGAKQRIDENPRNIVAARKEIHRLITIQRKYNKRDIKQSHREFNFPDVVAYKYDRFGIMQKIVKVLKSFTDSKEQVFLNESTIIKEARRAIANVAINAIGQGDFDFGKAIMGREVVPGGDQKPVGLYREGTTGFTHKDGRQFVIIDVAGDELKVQFVDKHKFAETKAEVIDISNLESINPYDTIKDALIKKYTDELTADILSGKTRYVVGVDKISKANYDKVNKQLIEIGIKYGDNVWANKYEHKFTKREGGKTYEYTYFMVKQGEGYISGDVEELYNAVLYKRKDVGSDKVDYYWSKESDSSGKEYWKFDRESSNLPSSKDVFNDGFYEAKGYGHFGGVVNKRGDTIADSIDGSWKDFSRMRLQPAESIVSNETGFWGALKDIREQYIEIKDKFKAATKINEQNLQKYFNNLKNEYKDRSDVNFKELLTEVAIMFGIENRVWVDDNEGVHTMNSYFNPLAENFFPNMYHDDDHIYQVQEAIRKITETIEQETDEAKIADFRAMLVDFNDALLVSVNGNLVLGSRSIHVKHRKALMNPLNMRKDGDVHTEYINSIANNLQQNALMFRVLDSLTSLSQTNKNGKVKTRVDYIINRTKIALGRPNYKATLFGIDISPIRIASALNKRFGEGWISPEGAERLFKHVNGIISAILLGQRSANTNRFQTVNNFIAFGWELLNSAQKKLYSKDADVKAMWDYIVMTGGTRNLIAMLNDVMMIGGDTELADAGFLGKFPTFNMLDYAKLISMGRQNFIKNSDKNTDDFLSKLEVKRVKRVNKFTKRLSKKATTPVEIRRIEELRGLYYDIISSENKDNEAVLKQRFRKLVGNISDSKMRSMVTWKLSFHFEPAKKLFTFTGTEQDVRDETYISSLLNAEKAGYLGDSGDAVSIDHGGRTIQIPKIYLSKQAIDIGRNAVYGFAFGMSPVYMGEAFGGLGRSLFHYKGYGINQTRLDSDFIRSFWYHGESRTENAIRLFKAMKDIKGLINPNIQNKNDKNFDRTALIMARMMYTRVAATVAASLIGLVPIVGTLSYRYGMMNKLRGIESPIAAVAGRIISRAAFWAIFGFDDDDDDGVGQDIIRLVLPPSITLYAPSLYKGIKSLTD